MVIIITTMRPQPPMLIETRKLVLTQIQYHSKVSSFLSMIYAFSSKFLVELLDRIIVKHSANEFLLHGEKAKARN